MFFNGFLFDIGVSSRGGMNRVYAVIVVYFPDIKQLYRLIDTLSTQVQTIIIVDNSDDGSSLSFSDSKLNLHYIKLSENLGIAKAQNIGIIKARELNATDVILFDQDSLPFPDMITNLLDARRMALNEGLKVAAVGPVQIDVRSGCKSPFVTHGRFGPVLLNESTEDVCTPIFLIASGCLISIDVFSDIGLKEESLFIDCVDIEWCFRAASKDYVCVGSFTALLNHELGDIPMKVFGKKITYHSPLRHYYFYRNFYNLLRREYVPVGWKVHVFIKSSLQACIFTLFSRERLPQVKMILKGIFHGLIGKMGKYEE